MTVAIAIPDGLWPDGQMGVIATWLYEDGDMVEEGVVVAEIMIDKTQIELPSPASGRLTILKRDEEEVACGEVIGELRA
nr:lipoyl domain-containing protein [Sphingomonas sp. Y57]